MFAILGDGCFQGTSSVASAVVVGYVENPLLSLDTVWLIGNPIMDRDHPHYIKGIFMRYHDHSTGVCTQLL